MAYVAESKKQLFLAGLSARKDINRLKLGERPQFLFRSEIKAQFEPVYLRAARSVQANPELLNRLKDAHAYWLSSIDDLIPRQAEAETEFEHRLSSTQFQHSVRVNRLTLG